MIATLEMPVIHLNGSGAARLAESYGDAIVALRDAIAKVQEASPNARDYYPNGPASFTRAAEQHRARMRALELALEKWKRSVITW